MNHISNINSNIRHLCKIQGKWLGDAERYAGKRAGYLSRNSHMDVCTLIRFAEFFSVTPNDLIYKNYRKDEIDKEIGELNRQAEELQKEITRLEIEKNSL